MTDHTSSEASEPADALPTLWVREDEARSPVRVSLTLDEDQLALLADRCGLQSVENFKVKATASRVKGGKLRVEGGYNASLNYLCGVTLQPFGAMIEENFNQIFVDPERLKPAGDTIDVDPLSDNDPDVLTNGAADIADLAFQLFALALDPYPRHPDAAETLPGVGEDQGEQDDEKPPSPFAVLNNLKLN